MSQNVPTSLQCEELVSGQRNHGLLTIGPDEIHVEIVSFENFLNLNPRSPVHLRTEGNDIVSLFRNTSAGSGRRVRLGVYPLETSTQTISSSLAIIGDDKWTETDRVSLVYFDVLGCGSVLDCKDKIRQLSSASLVDASSRTLFEVTLLNVSVRVFYSYAYSFYSETASDVRPTFELQFGASISLADCELWIAHVVNFLTIVTGVSISASDVRLSRLSATELELQRASDDPVSPHRAHYLRRRSGVGLRTANAPSIYSAGNDASLAALAEALRIWLERGLDWVRANALMRVAIDMRQELSAERILNSCRWLEEIPTAGDLIVVDEKILNEIVEAAVDKARNFNLSDLRHRISGSLRKCGTETHQARFDRLATRLTDRFGAKIVSQSLVPDLLSALKLRGAAAHGYLGIETSNDVPRLYRAICAMETMCFLLSIEALPPSPNESNRLSSHYLIQDYKFCDAPAT